ncbi:YmfL family putative regulatory protein, partial [Escherichia coli]
MGKHHWKIEKQPEWYVKAVRKTIAALPGGYAEAADWLDVTENALFNRLRADGDQIFPLGWAMVLQRAGGTHFIADAVAQSANGVFVSLPDVEDVDNADINLNRPGFPGECFICELRLPDHRFRWKH